MQPVVCNKDMAVSFPLKDGDCEFWLEIVDSVDDITNPSRDHAYVDSKGLFYIYNGKEIQVINDHANLKIKWGNMIGDISNQLDLMEILNQFVKTISVNGTNIAKDNEKNIAIQVPITTIKLDGNTISPVDYIVNLDLASVYAKKTEIPKNVSELENDAGYIKQEDMSNQELKMNTLFLDDIVKNGNITNNLSGSTFTIDGNTYESVDNKIQRLSVNDLKNGHKYIMCVKPLSATTEGATSIYLNVKTIYGDTYRNDLYPTTNIKIGDVVHFELPSTIDWKAGSDGINYTSICIRSGDAWILSAEIYIYDVSNLTANNLSIFDFNSPSTTLSIADAVMNIKEDSDEIKKKLTNWYYGKKMICYGDSITQGGMWRDVVKEKLGFVALTNNGIGGTKISYGGEKDMCSDSRLNDLPTDYDVIYVMGGTNDMGGNVPIGTSDYKDGGFDKTTFKGAIAYIITKLQELMPNTMIIFGTPCSGRGTTTGKNMTEQVKNTLNLSTEDYAKAMVEVCHEFSIPVIDVFGTCGINQFNRATYIQDSVHPNWEGHKLVAKAIVNGLKTNMPIY